MSNPPTVKDTAFWTACARSLHPELSRDIYAKIWANEISSDSYKNFMKHVYKYDAHLAALRNRFFLDEIKAFFSKFTSAALVNIGAGFSNYPFLLSENHDYVEIDCKENIEFKKSKLQDQKFPERKIDFYGTNLDDTEFFKKLITKIRLELAEKPTFFLIEGVIYYLQEKKARELLNSVSMMMQAGDRLGLVTLNPSFKNNDVFKSFCNFAENDFGEIPSFSFFEDQEISNYPGLKKLLHKDYFDLVKDYDVTEVDMSIPAFEEQHFILEKIAKETSSSQ